jgi:hypothetical protein
MRGLRRTLAAVVVAVLSGCNAAGTGGPVGPAAGAGTSAQTAGGPFEHGVNGGYHFTVPADFNGGIFGGEVGNRVTVSARRDAAGVVAGRYHYEQTFGGETFTFSGPVTCFRVYDTPVLERFPEIPPMEGNRAKWGGVIESSTDPTVPPGMFIWFQSIDNGEGRNSPPDLSTLGGVGDEAANEAFCDSDLVPNTMFGPHAVTGNVQVR